MTNPEPIFSLNGVLKYYPVLGGILKRKVGQINVLNGIDFSIVKGEIFGLVGESGCGKSTLARLLIKLEDPSGGTIRFNNQLLGQIQGADKKRFYRMVQIIFQDPFSSLNPRMKVKDIIGEMVRIQGIGKEAEKEKTLNMLREVELNEVSGLDQASPGSSDDPRGAGRTGDGRNRLAAGHESVRSLRHRRGLADS